MTLTCGYDVHPCSTAQVASANLGGRFGPQVPRAPAGMSVIPVTVWEGALLMGRTHQGSPTGCGSGRGASPDQFEKE